MPPYIPCHLCQAARDLKKKSYLITKPEKHTYIYHYFIDVLLLLKQTKGSKDNLENIRMN